MNRRFPIMDGPSIPWSAIAPHERQALQNHDQSLKRLAARGGLDPIEAVLVMTDRSLREHRTWTLDAALTRLAELCRPFEDTERELVELRERLEKAEQIIARKVHHDDDCALVQHPGADCDCDEIGRKLRAELAAMTGSRDAERLRYGQQRARNAIFMQAMASLAREDMQERAQAWVKAADQAASNVRLEDFVVAKVD